MGDETWEGLFPDTFHKSFPFPSFNVKDLHTVDNGVIQHLVSEIRQKNWDVMIGHFLGVDHCGHRYGPYHHAMADKLKQMNDVLRYIKPLLIYM
jgi:phosphatidylinositol glycan class O